MPKNAVERLQKIESDIKTVISIYDVANNSSENAKPEEPTDQEWTERRMDNLTIFDKIRQKSTRDQSTLFKGCKKGNFISPPIKDYASTMNKKNWSSKKPGSAPNSSITLSTINESDYFGQSPPGFHDPNLNPEKFLQSKTLEDFNSLEWFDPGNYSPVYEVFMSPSQTIQTAKEVLAQNNYRTSEDEESEEKHVCESRNGKKGCCKNESERRSDGVDKVKPDSRETNINSNVERILNDDNKKTAPNRTRSLSPGIEYPLGKEIRWGCHHPITSKSFAIPKVHFDPKKEKSSTEISRTRSVIPKKIPRPEKQRPGSPEPPGRKIASVCVESKERGENQTKNWCCMINIEGEGARKIRSERLPSREREASKEETKDKADPKHRNPIKFNMRGRREDKTDGGIIEPSNAKESKPNSLVPPGTEKTTLTNLELRPHELFKIIEKIEKMKISKELALDIAKQMKAKYEELQRSKEELAQRLKKFEEDNERLNKEIKDANDSKLKLQLKMEGYRLDSKSMIWEQGHRNREVIDENIWLKSKLDNLEDHHTKELLKKELQIEKIKEDRYVEEKMAVKKREVQAEKDVETLSSENTKLLAKVKELLSFLDDRHSKKEILEEKISELQEEVRRQKQHLKQKTERLEDTNKELEAIRQTSKDLEEQVKILRKNIENFDEMHQNLVKRTTEYERQIKSQNEEINQIQEERNKVQRELDIERDSILIKNKIIDDQQETIKLLREKADEAKSILKKNESLERILNIEREEKLELQEAVELLKWRKEELKKRIRILEGDLLLAPQDVVRDLQRTQTVLHELENQVQIKQKEWELHFQTLVREKEQACSVAEFATKKLMQTTNEFQKQSEAQKKLHRALAENLAEKERHLRELSEKKNEHQTKNSMKRNLRESEKQDDDDETDGGDDFGETSSWLDKKVSSTYFDSRPKGQFL